MKLKYALWATLAWTVVVFTGSGLGFWYITTHPIPGASTEQRAGMLGQGTGMVLMIGYGLIWLPSVIRASKRRREERETAVRKRNAPR